MKIIYVADDGAKFYDEYACRDHEWMLEHKEVLNSIEFYDKDSNKIENIITENAYNKVWTIVVPTDEAVKTINDLGDYQGFCSYNDICSTGTWEWHEDGWNGGFVKKEVSNE